MTSRNFIFSATNALCRSYLKKFIYYLFVPLDYTRTVEIPVLLEESGIFKDTRELRILDVASPQILSLTLAKFQPKWTITYINNYKADLDEIAASKHIMKINNLSVVDHDITEMLSVDEKFDYIFSCSVIEHIAPENGGDTLAVSNIRNILKNGGIFTFSVPFSTMRFSEYTSSSVYGRENNDGTGFNFFQRFYDEESLYEQIILPSQMHLVKIFFVGERFWFPNNPRRRLALLFSNIKSKLVLGRFFGLLSTVFMCEASDWKILKKPYLAIVVLKSKE
jgi:SAM-dependent methyltransferase